ncbi:MAG TPA: hypothetical protein VJA27_02710 [Patescibacteria group bacterium]|nr:hypothetical protein [Patescibacteria group bacterium]
MKEKFFGLINATKEFLAGEKIDRPAKLAQAIKGNVEKVKGHLSYLKAEEKARLYSEMELSTIMNPVIRELAIMADKIDTYRWDSDSVQTIRVTQAYDSFLKTSRQSKVEELPRVLEDLITAIESIS